MYWEDILPRGNRCERLKSEIHSDTAWDWVHDLTLAGLCFPKTDSSFIYPGLFSISICERWEDIQDILRIYNILKMFVKTKQNNFVRSVAITFLYFPIVSLLQTFPQASPSLSFNEERQAGIPKRLSHLPAGGWAGGNGGWVVSILGILGGGGSKKKNRLKSHS